jgi:hypothetical protein
MMPKVKKYQIVGPFLKCKPGYDVLDFDVALQEIVYHNFYPHVTKENEQKVREQLVAGFMVNTESSMYHVIHPIKDLIENIDDYVNLDDEKEEWF